MTFTVQFVGDCAACRDDPASIFAGTSAALSNCDVLAGQLETTITDRGERSPNASLAMRTRADFADVLARQGFAALSLAGNHALDWGYEGLHDTLAHVRRTGVQAFGAGATIAEAREPAIVETGGKRIAFLGYCSILPDGYAATEASAGCAPLRAHTFYEMVEPDQPGTPPRIRTNCHADDLADLERDIRLARQSADLVFVSIHWGLHMVEAVIADYQRELAQVAARAGASAVFGHHPHILKAVEFVGGMPVFHSLGNFAIEQPQAFDPAIVKSRSFAHLMSLNPDARPNDIYVLPPDTRMTGIARLEFDADCALLATRFIPCWIGDDSVPRVLAPDDPRFMEVADYLCRISRSQGIALQAVAEGEGLVLSVGTGD